MNDWRQHFYGKVALITGGTEGIGKAIAAELGSLGAKVVICSRSQGKVEKAAADLTRSGFDVTGIPCDVRDKAQVDGLVSRTIDTYGRIDMLVNNAGLYPVHPFLEMTEDQWDEVVDTNLKGVFLVSQRVARVMTQAGGGGAIVNIGSTSSHIARPGVAHYCSSKAALNMLTKVMAIELAPWSIRVNALCPGVIGTETAASTTLTPEGQREYKAKMARIPLGRVGTPEEIAHAVAFLLSPGSAYFTASVIYEDGGYTAGISSY